MLRTSMVSLSILTVLCTLVHANPTVYSGALTSAEGGIIGIAGNPWLTSNTTFAWTVTGNTNGTYTYEYRLTVPNGSKQISHLIMEVSPTFTSADLLSVTAGTLDGSQPDSYLPAAHCRVRGDRSHRRSDRGAPFNPWARAG